MTKRRPEPPLSAIKDLNIRDSIWHALEGNLRPLLTRLRRGTASPEEQKLIAELHEATIEPRQAKIKPRQITRDVRLAIAETVAFLEKIRPEQLRKQTLSRVAEQFGVCERIVYLALAQFDTKALSQIDQMIQNSIESGRLVELMKKGPDGQVLSKFFGSPGVWMNQFAPPRRYWTNSEQLEPNGCVPHADRNMVKKPDPS